MSNIDLKLLEPWKKTERARAIKEGKPYIVWVLGSYNFSHFEKDYDSTVEKLEELTKWQSKIGEYVDLSIEKIEPPCSSPCTILHDHRA